tara:strand:- start:580 stop:720 length:141 start_codon:yes stop_codon:yes gene_type:complete
MYSKVVWNYHQRYELVDLEDVEDLDSLVDVVEEEELEISSQEQAKE